MRPSGDYIVMRCEEFQEAISARLDGEPTPIAEPTVAAHVARCAECRAFEASAVALHRSLRVRTAAAVPDLTAAILATAKPAPRREWPRYALLWVGLTQLALAVPALAGDGTGASTHVARELGSWDIALAVGLLVAAWQPRRAAGLLPFALALAGAMALTSVLDIAGGRVPAAGEAQHLLDLVGVGSLWVLVRSAPGPSMARRLVRA
jgi:predicted anti-sigma-YlaC factor YlaD